MSKKEIQIISKIIRELSLFLMLHGYRHFTLDMKQEEKMMYLIIKLASMKEETLKKMQEKILRDRELEVETYGWELLGDTDSKSELDVVGVLIDDMTVEKNENEVILTFIRKNAEKK